MMTIDELLRLNPEGYEFKPGHTYIFFLDQLQIDFEKLRKILPLPNVNILWIPVRKLPGDKEAALAKLFEVKNEIRRVG